MEKTLHICFYIIDLILMGASMHPDLSEVLSALFLYGGAIALVFWTVGTFVYHKLKAVFPYYACTVLGFFVCTLISISIITWPKHVDTYVNVHVSGSGGLTKTKYNNADLANIPPPKPKISIKTSDKDKIYTKVRNGMVFIGLKESFDSEEELIDSLPDQHESVSKLLFITFDKPAPNRVVSVTPVNDVSFGILDSGENYVIMEVVFKKRDLEYKIEFK